MYPSNSSRWIKGPDFLLHNEQLWPEIDNKFNVNNKELLEERIETNSIHIIQNALKCISVIDFTRYSSYRKLFRVMAWVFKAKNIFLKRSSTSKKTLSYEEFQESKLYLFKVVQNYSFRIEIDNIENKVPLERDCNIRKLCPFIDDTGLLRVKGRLENALFMKYSARHPIILPKDHSLTTLIIRQFHEDLAHQNRKLILNEIKMKFYIPNLKRQLEKVSRNCMFCKIKSAKITQPMMNSLPIERISPFIRPFSFTGLDYCGHYFIKNKRSTDKVWIVLFTCMSTRAIHLEVVNSLKSNNCLLAVSNFINRRGIPIQLRTDNAGYFLKSKKLLSEIISLEDIERNIAKYNIKWVTNTPDSPHMGGAWERLIKCVKRVLDVTIKSSITFRSI